MKTLENVTLDSANMTDASLEVLAKLPNLRTLQLRRGKFTAAAKEKLQKTLPAVTISY
jgi:hypothetical protein